MRTLFIIIFSLMTVVESYAQNFKYYNYSIVDGLPSAEVYDIIQDKKGFIWFSTDNGVVRYDGKEMKILQKKDGLADPVIFRIKEDSKGRLWFHSFSGKLSYYHNDTIHQYRYNHLISRANPFDGFIQFTIGEHDNLTLVVHRFVSHIDSSGNFSMKEIKDFGLHHISADGQSMITIIAEEDPVRYIFINGKKYKIEFSKIPEIHRVNAWTWWKGKLYFTHNNEVFEFDGNRVRLKFTAKSLLISLSIDSNDHLWVGSMNNGVSRFEDDSFSNEWELDIVNERSVTKVIQDHEGGFWISTLENGVFYIPSIEIQHYSIPTTTRIRSVSATKTNVLAGDQQGKIFVIDIDTKRLIRQKNLQSAVISIYSPSDDRILVSTFDYLTTLSESHKLKEKKGVALDYDDDPDGIIWIVGANHIRKIGKNNNIIFKKRTTDSYRQILVEDSIFLASRTGMDILDKELNFLIHPKELDDYKISDIVSLSDSMLLITTIGSGFLILNKHTLDFKIYNSQNYFLADHIYSTAISSEDIWLGTEKGLIQISKDNILRDSVSFHFVGQKSGLPSDKIDHILDVGNALWVFSTNTFSVLPYDYPSSKKTNPIFYWKDFNINNIPYKSLQNEDLKYNQNNITISFGVISFNNPNVFYRYRLNKKDQWSYTDNDKLSFTSLAPGEYNLDLEFSLDHLRWHHANPLLTFKVQKPWWDTTYTYLGVTLIFLLLAFIYIRYQYRFYQQKNRLLRILNEHQEKLIQSEIVTLERERNRISKELHDRVGTNLTAIKLSVSQALKGQQVSVINEVENQFQQALREIKDIIYGLTPPSLERYGLFTGLKNYISKVTKNIPIPISLKTYGKEIDNYDLNIIVFRILQELITNSLRHSSAKNITIHLNSFEDVLNIVYEDDGVGFTYDPLQSGLGLDNIEARIRSLHGTLKFDSGDFGVSYSVDIPLPPKKETP